MTAFQGQRVARVPRSADTVFASVLGVVGGEGYRVLDVRPAERAVTFSRAGETTKTEWTYQADVAHVEDGAFLGVGYSTTSDAVVSTRDRWRARASAGRVVAEVEAAVEEAAVSAADEEHLPRSPAPARRFLADLTGRRAGLAALVLVSTYLVPVLIVWLVRQASAASLLGDSRWFAPALALTLGIGLVLALTVRFGGWFQAVSFGEEYMESFDPIRGWILGWLRFVVQIGALLLVIFVERPISEQVTAERISNAETAALPAYVGRAPIPDGWEKVSDRFFQSEYEDGPNASYGVRYVLPGDYSLEDTEAWLRSAEWATGVDGEPSFGALREIDCDVEYEQCDAEVTPPVGEPVEYTVEVRLDEATVVRDGETEPEEARTVKLEVDYEADPSRSD